MAIGNFGGLLEGISMVAHRASETKIDNIMVVGEFIISGAIKHHSSSPITIGKSDKSYMLNVKHYFIILFIPYRDHTVYVGKINRQITCIQYSLDMRNCNNCIII